MLEYFFDSPPFFQRIHYTMEIIFINRLIDLVNFKNISALKHLSQNKSESE